MTTPADGHDGYRPLAGVHVLELSRMLSGPMATMVLADLGADVVKVEHPGHGDETRAVTPLQAGESHYFISANRGKRSVALDITHPDAAEVLGALVSRADVVVENWRPGKLAALGFDFEWMRRRNERVVLCSITGFGQTGRDAPRPAFDLLTQALSGLMSINGEPESGPTKVGIPLADLAAGLWGAVGVLGALAGTPRRAVHLDIGMQESLAGLLSYLGQLHLATGEDIGPVGSAHPHVAPYGRFRAADGWVVLVLPTGLFWRRFCRAVGHPEWIEDPRFRTFTDRRAHKDELTALVAELIAQRTVAEWEKAFTDGDVPGGPVLGIGQALTRLEEAGRPPLFDVAVGERRIRSIRSPVRAVGDDSTPLVQVPSLGGHTEEVLAECGLSAARIAELTALGVVGRACSPGEHTTDEHTSDQQRETLP